MAMVGVAIRNSDHAFNTAHDTTDHTTDHSANRAADRAGRAVTHGGAACTSAHNALSLGLDRHGKSGNSDNGCGELSLHEQTPCCIFNGRDADMVPTSKAAANRAVQGIR